ncbi:hypothetical protein ACFQJ5_16775 [Halomicroarcula sp. GCM10025324]|uniref:hypothetical protein n=1 Tax=Haloarcula TaxID=2237 RepID=UPI0023E842B4|nr:hypothetical protein [Halomicroarcula sp. ZS-22-S1]
MPSTHQSSDRRERLHCPNAQERLGEDPARWLDWDFLRDSARKDLVWSLIDGMDSLERVRIWKGVERKIANDRAEDEAHIDIDQPRGPIMQRLDQREEWLTLHGERPDRLPDGPRRPCDCCDSEEGVSPADLRERDETAAARLVDSHESGGVDTSETSPATEPATLGAFATDGGEDA